MEDRHGAGCQRHVKSRHIGSCSAKLAFAAELFVLTQAWAKVFLSVNYFSPKRA